MKTALNISASPHVLSQVLSFIATLDNADVTIETSQPAGEVLTAGEEDDNNQQAPAGALFDTTGLPWDERIHSGGKTQTKKGVWSRRKGVDDAMFDAVTNELRAAQQSAPAPAAPAPAPAAPAPAPAAPAPAPAAPAPAPAAPLDPATVTFGQFMQQMTGNMSAMGADGLPKTSQPYFAELVQRINTAYAAHGVAPLNAVTDLANNPAQLKYAVELVVFDGRW